MLFSFVAAVLQEMTCWKLVILGILMFSKKSSHYNIYVILGLLNDWSIDTRLMKLNKLCMAQFAPKKKKKKNRDEK